MTKSEIAEKLFEKHQSLLEYHNFLKNTVSQIIINSTPPHYIFKTRFGTKFEVPPNLMDPRYNPIECLNFGSIEGSEEILMHLIAEKMDYFIDIGANIGWHTCNVAFTHNNIKHIFAVEPQRKAFKILQNHVQLNNLSTRVTLRNIAVSDFNGTANLSIGEELGAGSFYNIRELQSPTMEEVIVQKFDDLLRCLTINFQPESKTLIKLDIEGSELFFLNGAKSFISHSTPIFFIEILRKWCRKAGYEASDIIQFFQNYGYSLYKLCECQLCKIHQISDDTLQTNFFAFSESHADLISELNTALKRNKKYNFLIN